MAGQRSIASTVAVIGPVLAPAAVAAWNWPVLPWATSVPGHRITAPGLFPGWSDVTRGGGWVSTSGCRVALSEAVDPELP